MGRRWCPWLILLASVWFAGCQSDTTSPHGPSEAVIRQNSLGTAYLSRQSWGEAEAAFRKAAELGPDDPVPPTNAAVALVQQGRIEEAEALLRQALTYDPDFPYTHFNLGLIEKNRGNFEAAAEHFRQVEQYDPEDLLTQYNLGIVLSRIGQDDDALAAFERALDRDPTHVSTLYGLGQFLLRGGEVERGQQLIARSAEIRARSGLDEAVGTQYGEQGPYAMGADYPADTLPAPQPIQVRLLRSVPEAVVAGAGSGWARSRDGAGEPHVLLPTGKGVAVLGQKHTAAPGSGPEVRAAAAGDMDDDGTVEIAVWLVRGTRLELALATETPAAGPIESFSTERLHGERSGGPSSAQADLEFVDRDHDGDLDLFACWTSEDGSGCRIGTNDGEGNLTLLDATDHGLARGSGAAVVGLSDFDNDRDIDLLQAGPTGVSLLANQRDDTFADVTASAIPTPTGPVTGLVVADVNKDGWMDLVLAGADGARVLRNVRGVFEPGPALGEGTALGLVVFDHDNDGFLDVVCGYENEPPLLFRNLGTGRWEPTPDALAAAELPAGSEPLTALDADGDGDLDLVVRDAGRAAAVLLINEGGNARHWLAIDSQGAGDNHFGIGAKVEILSGALRQKFEITDPVPLQIGLGDRSRVESVRHLWPSGVLQDEVDLPADEVASVTQLDRKGTSCPLLYAHSGDGWRFVTDFLGGAAVGYRLAPGRLNTPDTDEYVKIEGGIVADEQGQLRLRLNNQLEEVIWFDQVELVTVDHPVGTEVFPHERLMPGPPWPEFELFAGSDVRPVASARSAETGTDFTAAVRSLDRRYAGDFAPLPYKGYATLHTLELDLGALEPGRRVVLLLDGWIDYADSSSNVAAAQAGVQLVPPRLHVPDGRGGWRLEEPRLGFPAGLPKTMTVELTDRLTSGDRRLRIETNMRIHWDRIRVLVGGEQTPLDVRRLSPVAAKLRHGGFPRPSSPDGAVPFGYDPDNVDPLHSWKAHVGAYTAYGNVRELLAAIDDAFVTTRNGDEVELNFASPAEPRAGWTRTYLLYADGFGKDMDPNSAASETIAPIPFHGMPSYPYPDDVVPPAIAREPNGRRWVGPSARGRPGALPLVLARESADRRR